MRFITIAVLVLSCPASLTLGTASFVTSWTSIGQRSTAEINTQDQIAPSQPVQGGFLGFSIVGRRNVWAIGTEGEFLGDHASVILRSTNGGQSWTRELALAGDHLFDISFFNDQIGWVAGASGTLLKSTDGGRRWERQKVPTESNLNKIQFINAEYGWVSGFDGELLRTEDGGNSWRSYKLQESGWVGDQFKGFLKTFDFSDKLHGWIVGERGQVYRSTNGGKSWQSRGPVLAKLIQAPGPTSIDFVDVKFITPSLGIIVAQLSRENGGDSAKRLVLFQTTSGGESWTVLKSFKEAGFVRSQFLGLKDFWIEVRYGRSLLHTRDGGKTWTMVSIPASVGSPLMYFIDSNEGWMASTLNGFSGVSLYTSDGGTTWVEQRVKYTIQQAKR